MGEYTSGRHNWPAVMKQVHDNPGEWVAVPGITHAIASKVRRGYIATVRNFLALVGGRIEVRQDPLKDGETRSDAAIRWIKEEEDGE